MKKSQMLIEFSVSNFRSFRDMQKFTMLAAPLRPNDSGLEESNVFEYNGMRMLKSKAIYGLNAGGKSNIVRAIGLFQNMVFKSVSNEDLVSNIWNEHFGLITDWDDEPVFFQLIFLENNIIHRYGFQIKDNKVTGEWLFSRNDKSEQLLFKRILDEVVVDSTNFQGGEDYIKLAKSRNHEIFRPDALFLTGTALMGNKQAQEIRDAICKIIFVDGAVDSNAFMTGMKLLEFGSEKEKFTLKEMMKGAETGMVDLQLIDLPDNQSNQINKGAKQKRLFSYRNRYDENGNLIDQINKPFLQWESEGTVKWFGISALILSALKFGRTFVIDEFDARFHPNLTLKIVELFHNLETNPHNAQLIFVSHDTGLLSRAKLRRDQICLVDKDKYGISTFRTLIEFKGVRKDESYEKEFLRGSYGAVAYLNEIDTIIKDYVNESDELSKPE